MDEPRQLSLLGLRLDVVERIDLLDRVDRMVSSAAKHTVMYLNVHVANCAVRDPQLRAALRGADLVYCDGAGVRLGARILGVRIPPRMTGADFIWDLAALAARRGHRLFWVGGQPEVARQAAQCLARANPTLEVVGTHHGYFERSGATNEGVIKLISDARPDIVLVGLGTPAQERWVAKHRQAIQAPVVWCIGATADFVGGQAPRAPRWMVRSGLEWLYRMWNEPRRMARRYVVGNPLFLARVIRQRLRG